MNAFMTKLPSILTLLVGGMSILAGGMVLRGWQPGWTVINWLPVYNFTVGLLTLVPAYLLWVGHRYALPASIAIFSIHTVILLLLLTILRNTAAFQSVGAMSFRVVTWIVIIALLRFQRYHRGETKIF